MADFRESLRKGLDAHQSAEEARNEIRLVVFELSRQVLEITSGKLKAEIRNLVTKKQPPSVSIFDNLFGVKATVLALIKHGEPEVVEELCEFAAGPAGYPVALTWEAVSENCYDRASLEQGLSRLLEQHETGAKIRRLLGQPTAPEPRAKDDSVAKRLGAGQPVAVAVARVPPARPKYRRSNPADSPAAPAEKRVSSAAAARPKKKLR